MWGEEMRAAILFVHIVRGSNRTRLTRAPPVLIRRIATPVTCADLTPLLPIGAPLGRRKDDVPVRELEGLCISRLGWLLAEGGSLTLPGELEGWWWELAD